MTAHCPTCGHALDDARPDASAFDGIPLTRAERRIVDALARAYPRYTSREGLIDALYFDDPNGGAETAVNVLATHITRVRKTLPQSGWTISNARVGRGNHGRYRLERVTGGKR